MVQTAMTVREAGVVYITDGGLRDRVLQMLNSRDTKVEMIDRR